MSEGGICNSHTEHELHWSERIGITQHLNLHFVFVYMTATYSSSTPTPILGNNGSSWLIYGQYINVILGSIKGESKLSPLSVYAVILPNQSIVVYLDNCRLSDNQAQ